MRHGLTVLTASDLCQGMIREITQTNAIHTCQIFDQLMYQIFDRIVMNEQGERFKKIKNCFTETAQHKDKI